MVLPILAYGNKLLQQECLDVNPDFSMKYNLL